MALLNRAVAAATAVLLAVSCMVDASALAPRTPATIDLSKIRIVDHSHGNFEGMTPEQLAEMYRGLDASMTCYVGTLQNLFSSDFLDQQGVYSGSVGAGASCPFNYEATAFGIGLRFTGTLAVGVAACPPTLFASLDSNQGSGSWQLEPEAEVEVVPEIASLVFSLDTDSSGNFMLKVTMSILDTDLDLAKDIYLGFTCDDLGMSVY